MLDVTVIFQVYINIIYNLCFARYEYEYANNYEYKYELTKTKKVKEYKPRQIKNKKIFVPVG